MTEDGHRYTLKEVEMGGNSEKVDFVVANAERALDLWRRGRADAGRLAIAVIDLLALLRGSATSGIKMSIDYGHGEYPTCAVFTRQEKNGSITVVDYLYGEVAEYVAELERLAREKK